jgi:hypothetical protein
MYLGNYTTIHPAPAKYTRFEMIHHCHNQFGNTHTAPRLKKLHKVAWFDVYSIRHVSQMQYLDVVIIGGN